MSPMSTRRHRRRLGTNKSLPPCYLSHRLSQVSNLPSLLRIKRRRSPHPLGPHHPFPTQPLSHQHAPFLSHHPSRQAEPRPIPYTPPAALRRYRLRQAAQNQKPTSARRAFLRPSMRPRPNLANPSLVVPLNDHALCPCLAIPRTRMAARTRSAASRRSPPVLSAASCRARRRLQGFLVPKGRITDVHNHPLWPTVDSIVVRNSRWMP